MLSPWWSFPSTTPWEPKQSLTSSTKVRCGLWADTGLVVRVSDLHWPIFDLKGVLYLNVHLPFKKLYSQAHFPEHLAHCTSCSSAELSLVFVDKPEKANLLLEGVENKLTPGLKVVVLMDAYGSDLVERGKKCGVEITSMKALEVSPALQVRRDPRVVWAQVWHPVDRTGSALAGCLSHERYGAETPVPSEKEFHVHAQSQSHLQRPLLQRVAGLTRLSQGPTRRASGGGNVSFTCGQALTLVPL